MGDATDKTVNLVDMDGVTRAVPESEAQYRIDRGWRVETADDAAARATESAKEDLYGGALGTVSATAGGVLRGATGGASDAVLSAIGGADMRTRLRELRERHGVASIGGEVLGGFLPGGVGGLISKVGARAGQVAEGAGVLGQIAGAARGAAAEGALYGVGSGVSELALSEDPLTIERAASVLGSNALLGAATGGALGAAGKVAEKGLLRAKSKLDILATRANTADVAGDLAGLDAKGLRAARETELDALHAAQVSDRAAAKSSAVDDVIAYRQQVKEANPWLVIDEGEQASQLNKAKRQIRSALDDPKGLRENPGTLLKPLRYEEQALEGAIAKREAIAARLESANQKIGKSLSEELATLPDKATHVELSGKAARRYASYADVKVGKDAVIKVAREDAQNFLQALERGEVNGASRKALDNLSGLLEQNRALQTKIQGATKPLVARGELASERLSAIAGAKDALTTGATKKGFGDVIGDSALGYAVGAAAGVPVLGHAIAAARVGMGLVKKLGLDTTQAAARGSKAIDTFLDVGRKVARPTPVIASKVLTGIRYGLAEDEKVSKKAATLADAYRARSSEIRALTAPGQDGSPVMRPEARAKIAAKLRPIAAVSPRIADGIETAKARAIEFLAGKLPRKPDAFGTSLGGPDTWQPSDMEMRTWARYASAVDDPHGVVERLASGDLTPEDAEAMKTVYPEMYADIKGQIMAKVGELRAKLPYQRRLALSIFSGVPVDPALDPRVLAALQGTFAAEAGTEGGVQAPRAQPAFGSVSKPEPTPAQQRGA